MQHMIRPWTKSDGSRGGTRNFLLRISKHATQIFLQLSEASFRTKSKSAGLANEIIKAISSQAMQISRKPLRQASRQC